MAQTQLHNKVVLITGANHGIGAATARAFAAEGARVLLSYLRIALPAETRPGEAGANKASEPDQYQLARARSADAVIQTIRDSGGEVESLEADLSDPASIPMLFEHAESLFGPVDVLVNNADHCEQDTFLPEDLTRQTHVAPDGFPTHTITANRHDQHFAVNSRAVALMMAEFARRHMVHGKQWGRIINISTDGAPGFQGTISYGASKAALESYSRAAAKELGSYGITVNIVSPGPVQTGWISPALATLVAQNTPLGRVGQPEDIADVIVFLASEQARWITGQLLSVSGGHRMVIG